MTCPYCQFTDLPNDATTCPNCGRVLPRPKTQIDVNQQVGENRGTTTGVAIGAITGDVTIVTSGGPDIRPRAKPRLPYEPETVLIPSGPFWMGSEPGDNISEHETPRHQVILKSYHIGHTPVTNRQYAEFIKRVPDQQDPKGWFLRKPPADRLDHPVTEVSWYDAMAYCAWLSEMSGRPYRLPSEAEWEKAARGDDGRIYPWGTEWVDGRCNVGNSGTTAVTAFVDGASPAGCLDLLGNVQEWTQTLWGNDLNMSEYLLPIQRPMTAVKRSARISKNASIGCIAVDPTGAGQMNCVPAPAVAPTPTAGQGRAVSASQWMSV